MFKLVAGVHTRELMVCFQFFIGCTNGDIRLAGSSYPLQGRVEMCYDGVWGTVCSNLWGVADAAVVCRQLGYSSSGKYCQHAMLT